jgi:hypothetical protein
MVNAYPFHFGLQFRKFRWIVTVTLRDRTYPAAGPFWRHGTALAIRDALIRYARTAYSLGAINHEAVMKFREALAAEQPEQLTVTRLDAKRVVRQIITGIGRFRRAA